MQAMNNLYSRQGVYDYFPPKLIYFAIYNTSLNVDLSKEEKKSDEDAELKKQILCYLSFENREPLEVEKVKRVGITLGLRDFAKKFHLGAQGSNIGDDNESQAGIESDLELSDSGSGEANYIDTDKSRIMVCELEKNYWAMIGIRRGYVAKGDKIIEYTDRGLAPSEYIINEIGQGYKIFLINYGSMNSMLERGSLVMLKEHLEKWWKKFLSNKFEFSSSYLINDRGILNLMNGYRRSGSSLPIGFQDNLEIRITELVKKYNNDNHKLVDLIIMNTNWVPSKNFGVLYQNKDSKIESNSLINLISYIEKLDLSFGLSTYLLTMDNLPSLKNYISHLQRSGSILNDGTLFERSLLRPAKFLHEQLNSHFFDPLNSAVGSMASFIPQISMPTMSTFTNAVPTMPTMSAISTFPKLPGMSLFGGSSSSANSTHTNPDSTTAADADATHTQPSSAKSFSPVEHAFPGELTNPALESLAASASLSNSQEMREQRGSYLIGLQKINVSSQTEIEDNFISYKHVYLQDSSTGNYRQYNLVIYEINGILYVMIFEDSNEKYLNNERFYRLLRQEMDSIYDLYFNDLIIRQVAELTKENQNNKRLSQTSFYYLIYDSLTKEFRSSMPNIPDDKEIRTLKKSLNFSNESAETAAAFLNFSLIPFLSNESEKKEALKQIELDRLRNQLILVNYEIIKFFYQHGNSNISSKLSILSEDESLLKTSNNWYFYKQMVNDKLVIIIKKIDSKTESKASKKNGPSVSALRSKGRMTNGQTTLDSLGEDVKSWFESNCKNGVI